MFTESGGTLQKFWCYRFLSLTAKGKLGSSRQVEAGSHPSDSGLQTPSETLALTLKVGTQSGALLALDGQGV